ncbi:MAG: choice-of-anchor Q domain-containing protein, partial [Mariprofundus sp.]|nr:choice-of-anchor Q domain-containing protein [Mariprofundus sp.]
YTLALADANKFLKVIVTVNDGNGSSNQTAASTRMQVINSAPTASSVTISGTATVGNVLTGSYTYADVDGDAQGTSTFRWLRGVTAITGATATTYTLVAADSGQTIKFEVTPVAATGTSPGTAVASAGTTVSTNSAPTASGVTVSGTASVGNTLTGAYTYNDVDGDAQGTSTFRWLRGGTAITGATATTYTLVTADSGATIKFEVTPVAATGTTTGIAVASTGTTITNSAPTASSVTVSGTATVGNILTGAYVYADVDGDPQGTSTFRWLRGGTAIIGATAQTYTLAFADSGQTIIFEVTPVALAGTITGTAVTSTAVVEGNSAPVASTVFVSGTTIVGNTLTGNYTYSDVDGDLEGTSTFRWLRNGTAIAGATNQTYTLAFADSGQTIVFEVTPVALAGTITGIAAVGSTLTGNYTYSDVDGDLEGTSTFRWLRGGTAITGATNQTYIPVVADIGQAITFEVTPIAATNTITGVAVASAGTTTLNSAPTASGVTVIGAATVGNTLTGAYTYADVDGDAQGTSIFRWLRGGTAITGATATTYTLVAADSGQTITFEVTPVAATGTTTGIAVTSAGTTILNSAPTASSVTVSGMAKVGSTLAGAYIYSDVDGDVQGTSTFRWLRNGTAITGATASSYTLVAADVGKTIKFEVTPIAATGATPGTAVVSVGTIITNSAPTASSVTIGGTTTVGSILTGHYTYGDVDGDLEGASTFRWLRNGTAITGATSSSYTLVAADVGKTIKFEVTPIAATGATPGTAVASAGMTITIATTLTVVTNADSGTGSLRQVIIDAADGDTIDFNLAAGSEVITVLSELAVPLGKGLNIDSNNILGSGTKITVQVATPGISTYRVFNFGHGAGKIVTLRSMIIKGGNISAGAGGAILMQQAGASLRLENCTVRDAKAKNGAGLSATNFMDVTILNSTFKNNVAIYSGGAIRFGVSAGNVTIQNSTIDSNSVINTVGTDVHGGGISFANTAPGGTLVIDKSTISNNSTASFVNESGGGLSLQNIATTTISYSTINNNTSTSLGDGGGIYHQGGTLFLTNSTVSGNTGATTGGGISLTSGTGATFTNVTIANNAAILLPNGGGAIYDSGTPLTMTNTLLGNNTANGAANDFSLIAGTVTDNGYNIVEVSSGYTWVATGDITGNQGSLNLSTTLAANNTLNGTKTLALSTGSVAINAGSSAAFNGTVPMPTKDQRGLSHVSTMDIGAYEFTPIDPTVPASLSAGGCVISSKTTGLIDPLMPVMILFSLLWLAIKRTQGDRFLRGNMR